MAVQQIVTPTVVGENIKNVRRRPRRPQHKFNIRQKPMQITPIMIAPVLPGETLQNLLLQTRVVTDPIKNRVVGWHKEYYFFYIPLPALKRDWDTSGLLQSMMLDPTVNVTSLQLTSAHSVPTYTYRDGMRYVKYCNELIVKEFFRDEGEAITQVIDDYPVAQIDQQSWFQSFKLESAGADELELPGVDEIEELDILPGFTTAYAQWELMRDAGMTDLDYDDFIKSYGVDVPKAEELQPDGSGLSLRPELIRFSRKWQYPSNTIDPVDGSATSAVSWTISERADKKRFFKYPGFVFGVTVSRPKVYLGNQKGAAIGFLRNAYTWLPAVLHGHVYASLTEIQDSPDRGIFSDLTEDYWFDCKDLFLYGDQFCNYVMDQANTNAVALPTAGGDVRYMTEAMADALFVGDTDNAYVREDGVVHLNVLGKLTDSTP